MITKRKFTFPTSTLLVGSLWNGKFSSEEIVRHGVCESSISEEDAEDDYNRRRRQNHVTQISTMTAQSSDASTQNQGRARQSYNKRGYVDATYNVVCDNGKHPSCACVSTGEGKSPWPCIASKYSAIFINPRPALAVDTHLLLTSLRAL